MDSVFKRNILWMTFLLSFAFSGSARAEPVLKAMDPSGSFYVDGVLQVQLVIEWSVSEGEYEIRVPENIRLHNLEYLGLSQSQETVLTSFGRIVRLVATYKLCPLQEGEGVVDAFEIPYQRSDGKRQGKISVPQLRVTLNPLLPWKRILILVSVLLVPVLLILAWLLYASWGDRQKERMVQEDPKQKLYADAAEKIGVFVSGYSESGLKTILAEWSAELKRVVMACYDLPVRSASKNEILRELAERHLPAGELNEVTALFEKLEHVKFSIRDVGSSEIDAIQRLLLQYIKGKIIIGDRNF